MPVGWYIVDPPMSGTLASTLKKLEASITAGITLTGTQASTLQKVQAALSGTASPAGGMDSTLQKVQSDLSGLVHPIGSMDSTLQKVSSNLVGAQEYTGTLASTLQKVQAAMVGEQPESGVAASTLQKVQASLSGVQVLPKIGTITEDWTAFTTKWNTRVGASNANGVLNLNSSGANARAGDSVFAYDLTSSAMFTEVPLAPSNTWFYAYSGAFDGSSYAGFRVNSGSIFFFETVVGTEDNISIAYTAGAHKWWRLREAAGTLYWETSSDGINWVIRRSKANGQSYTSVYPEFWVNANNGVAQFDNFNLPKVKSRPIRVMTRHRLR